MQKKEKWLTMHKSTGQEFTVRRGRIAQLADNNQDNDVLTGCTIRFGRQEKGEEGKSYTTL